MAASSNWPLSTLPLPRPFLVWCLFFFRNLFHAKHKACGRALREHCASDVSSGWSSTKEKKSTCNNYESLSPWILIATGNKLNNLPLTCRPFLQLCMGSFLRHLQTCGELILTLETWAWNTKSKHLWKVCGENWWRLTDNLCDGGKNGEICSSERPYFKRDSNARHQFA